MGHCSNRLIHDGNVIAIAVATTFIGLCLSFCVPGAAHADVLDGDQRGWMWYQLPPPPPKPLPPPRPVVQAPPKPAPVKKAAPKPAGPKVFSVQWIKHTLPKWRNRAINDPSTKNVTQYLALQKVMFDKAQNFAEKFVQVANTNPVLNYSAIIPRSGAGNTDFQSYLQQNKMRALRYLSKRVGMWVFVKHGCPFCDMQLTQYGNMNQMIHFATDYIDVNNGPITGLPKNAVLVQDHGQAKALHLVETPTIIMIYPPNNFAIVSQGYQVMGSLEDNILADAEYLHLLPKKLTEWTGANAYERGVLTTAQMKQAQNQKNANPQTITQYIENATASRISDW